MSKIIYANSGGLDIIDNGRPLIKEMCDTCEVKLKKSDRDLPTRRQFMQRLGGLLVPITLGGLFVPRSARGAGSTILTRTINSATQNAISMNNTTWARPVTLGSWNKVRIGGRMHFTDLGGNPANCILAIGLCSGTTNQYGDATTTHFAGVAYDALAGAYTRETGTNYVGYEIATANQKARKRVGTTNTDGATSLTVGQVIRFGAGAASGDPTDEDRTLFFVDITKGSPNYTFFLPTYSNSGTACVADISSANFITQMGLTTPAPASYPNNSASNSVTVAVNEGTDGTLNALNMYWNLSAPTLEVCDVAIAVLS